ncbi:MAG: phage portal protein [Pseudomonadota bacterium]
MRLITVQNCVRMRAATISRLPCHVMEQVGKRKQRADDFYLYKLLHDRPNSWMTAPEFWAMAEAHVSLTGNFCAYKIQGSGTGKVYELIPLKPGSVQEVVQNDDYSLTYRIRFEKKGGVAEVRDVDQQRIFHIRGLTVNGIMGVNPIEYARETIGLGMASTQFMGRWFNKGLHPSAVITHPKELNAQAFANRRDALKERYEGLGKTHEFMLLDEGMGIEWPKMSLVDAQYIEQMKLSDAQICGLFRVPLMLVNGGDKEPTYASAEQFMLFYQMFSIDASMYEAAIKRDLMSPEEQKRYYAKFSIEGLLRGSMEVRAKFYQTMVNSEIMNPNECRDLEDMNPYDGGEEYRTRTSSLKQAPQQGEKK